MVENFAHLASANTNPSTTAPDMANPATFESQSGDGETQVWCRAEPVCQTCRFARRTLCLQQWDFPARQGGREFDACVRFPAGSPAENFLLLASIRGHA